jgi:hypothetical protein
MKPGGAIPVIMYHSVGRPLELWRWSFLTVPAKIFEDHLKHLVRLGYQSITLNQLYDHVAGIKTAPEQSVVFTFDDGYLDNWTYAAPLLKKYGFCGHVFVNPEFVDPRDIIRPNLEEVWSGKLPENKLPVRGFMSWPELKSLNDSGVLSVQSHAMTHTWYPCGPEIADFHHPGDSHYWLEWNEFPDQKPFYLDHLDRNMVPWGTPVYVNAKSLECRRYFPDRNESVHLAEFVSKNGGAGFFEKPGWREKLLRVSANFRVKNPPSQTFEDNRARLGRVRYELTESKRLISTRLNCDVSFLCWPGGGYNDESFAMGTEIYRSVTLSSRDRSQVRNRQGDFPVHVKRVGPPYLGNEPEVRYLGGRYLRHFLDEYRLIKHARKKRRTLKAFYMARKSLLKF